MTGSAGFTLGLRAQIFIFSTGMLAYRRRISLMIGDGDSPAHHKADGLTLEDSRVQGISGSLIELIDF